MHRRSRSRRRFRSHVASQAIQRASPPAAYRPLDSSSFSIVAFGGSSFDTTAFRSLGTGSTAGLASACASTGNSGRLTRRMIGRQSIHTQTAFAPIAICFQFVPSLIARHGTAPVPPALK